jgi:hypothetical protein
VVITGHHNTSRRGCQPGARAVINATPNKTPNKGPIKDPNRSVVRKQQIETYYYVVALHIQSHTVIIGEMQSNLRLGGVGLNTSGVVFLPQANNPPAFRSFGPGVGRGPLKRLPAERQVKLFS